jgi:hypothetical protein
VLARFESSRVGQVVISLGAVVVLVCIVVINLPDSRLKQDSSRYTLPVANAAGLNQDWSIFSQPRTIAAYVDAQIDFADGSSSVQGISTGHWLGAYVDYRWQKYEEVIRPDSGRIYWHDYAEFVAARARTSGRDPVRVTLIRRFAPSLPPGPGPAHGPEGRVTMYVLDLGRAG